VSVPRVALIGAGRWGRNLARNLHTLGALAAVVDRHQPSLDAIQEQYPGIVIANDLAGILPQVDAVVIATSAPTHFAIASQALDAGKDVYIEKPITLDYDQGAQLVERATAEGRILMVGHLLQYHPVFVRMRELVAAGEIGALRYIAATRMGLGTIRTEESSLWCLAPHDISMILALMGDRLPRTVVGRGTAFTTPGIEDVTVSHLEFAPGVGAHIVTNWMSPVKEQRLQVVGSTGILIFDDRLPWAEKLTRFDQVVEMREGIPTAVPVDPTSIPVPEGEPLRAEMQHFLDRIADRQAPRSDGPEALRVLRVLHAAQASIAAGGATQQL
jgi:UDP-2-acetamido-3-amino-2,3-dideoxy-glucuronate N-acetyltransferase